MSPDRAVRQGQLLIGQTFDEPMRVVTAHELAGGTLNAGLVGERTQRFRQVTLTAADIADLQIIETSGDEAKLHRLREILNEQGFFSDSAKQLLIFTEFTDTLNYLVEHLEKWGFRTGRIHGGMRPGSRDEPATRLHAEQRFRDGDIQVLVATEAAGEGINLQCCHILINYDIPSRSPTVRRRRRGA